MVADNLAPLTEAELDAIDAPRRWTLTTQEQFARLVAQARRVLVAERALQQAAMQPGTVVLPGSVVDMRDEREALHQITEDALHMVRAEFEAVVRALREVRRATMSNDGTIPAAQCAADVALDTPLARAVPDAAAGEPRP
jgi:hypothetical protein